MTASAPNRINPWDGGTFRAPPLFYTDVYGTAGRPQPDAGWVCLSACAAELLTTPQ
jgi:hypothetical protein